MKVGDYVTYSVKLFGKIKEKKGKIISIDNKHARVLYEGEKILFKHPLSSLTRTKDNK